MVGLFCTGYMDKSALMALALLLMLPGAMLLVGEYLCVEVAWLCLDYNHINVFLGSALCFAGIAAALFGKYTL